MKVCLKLVREEPSKRVSQIMVDILKASKEIIIKINLNKKDIDFVCGNAEVLPFEDNTFDAYTIGKIS